METPVLDVSRYRKEYRGKVAVSDLSLAVAPGEICGFIGHNGAGKTTLIRSVVGAQPPTSGTVRVCGRDVWREPVAAKRLMAYVPDNPDVYDFLTGAQYLDLIADVFGVGAEERRRRAGELAAEYEIEYRTPIFPICKKGRYGAFIGRTFESFSEYRALVNEVAREGGDFIKIMISGLMDFDHYGKITSEPLSDGEIRDMIACAHDCGFAVMAHANGAETVMSAVRAGVDSIEHGAYLSD